MIITLSACKYSFGWMLHFDGWPLRLGWWMEANIVLPAHQSMHRYIVTVHLRFHWMCTWCTWYPWCVVGSTPPIDEGDDCSTYPLSWAMSMLGDQFQTWQGILRNIVRTVWWRTPVQSIQALRLSTLVHCQRVSCLWMQLGGVIHCLGFVAVPLLFLL